MDNVRKKEIIQVRKKRRRKVPNWRSFLGKSLPGCLPQEPWEMKSHGDPKEAPMAVAVFGILFFLLVTIARIVLVLCYLIGESRSI